MTTEPILISQPEAARLLGISVRTLERIVRSGHLTPIRLTPTAHPRFRREDIARIVERKSL